MLSKEDIIKSQKDIALACYINQPYQKQLDTITENVKCKEVLDIHIMMCDVEKYPELYEYYVIKYTSIPQHKYTKDVFESMDYDGDTKCLYTTNLQR